MNKREALWRALPKPKLPRLRKPTLRESSKLRLTGWLAGGVICTSAVFLLEHLWLIALCLALGVFIATWFDYAADIMEADCG